MIRHRFNRTALQLQEELEFGLDQLEYFSAYSFDEYFQRYIKVASIFVDLSHIYHEELKRKKAIEKETFDILVNYYSAFTRTLTSYCLESIHKDLAELYDLLIIAWESLSLKSRLIDEDEKIEYCYELLNHLEEGLDEHDVEDESLANLLYGVIDDWHDCIDSFCNLRRAQ